MVSDIIFCPSKSTRIRIPSLENSVNASKGLPIGDCNAKGQNNTANTYPLIAAIPNFKTGPLINFPKSNLVCVLDHRNINTRVNKPI